MMPTPSRPGTFRMPHRTPPSRFVRFHPARFVIALLLTAVASIAGTSTAQAAKVYRCPDGSYADKPCGEGQRVVTTTRRYTAVPGEDKECVAMADDAEELANGKASGVTSAQALKRVEEAGLPYEQRTLRKKFVVKVYQTSGSPAEVRSLVEADCVSDKKAASKAAADRAAADKAAAEQAARPASHPDSERRHRGTRGWPEQGPVRGAETHARHAPQRPARRRHRRGHGADAGRPARHRETTRRAVSAMTTAAPAYERAASLALALERLGAGGVTVIAGGTDYYPSRVGRPADAALLDIADLPELRGITGEIDHWRIGAAATWADLLDAPLPAAFDGLRQAAREVGGLQIQNAGTIGGNLCNASPAADGIPALLALDAIVELRSSAATTTVPLSSFILGPRRTRRTPGPTRHRRPGSASAASRHQPFREARRAPLPGDLDRDGLGLPGSERRREDHRRPRRRGRVFARWRGACRRWKSASSARRSVAGLGGLVAHDHLAPLSPIDDVRASRAYRLDAARTVVARLLDDLPTPQ
jgi:CO/xanthine dehydrogenase FAD-binding subunit